MGESERRGPTDVNQHIVAELARRIPLHLLCLPLLACLLTLPSLIHGYLIGGGETPHEYLRRLFTIRQLALGQLPSWNPYLLSGYPHIADPPTAFFYPFSTVLLTVLPVGDAMNLSLLIHLTIAGIFMYLYLGGASLSRHARLLGAIVYMLAGHTATRVLAGHIERVEIYAWIPLLLYLIDQIVGRRHGLGAALLGATVIACQFFAGDPQSLVYSSLAIGAYAIFRLIDASHQIPRHADTVRIGLLLVVMFAVAAFLSLAQLLPSLQYLAESNRGRPSGDFSLIGSMPPVGLVSMFAPLFFGNQHTNWGQVFGDEFYFDSSTLYVGFFTLALILTALLTQRNRWHVRFFALFGLAVLWIMLGRFGYVYRLVEYVPVLRNFKDIENANMLVPLCAAPLAAIGFDTFRDQETPSHLWTRVLALLFLGIAAGTILAGIAVLLRGGVLIADKHVRAEMVQATKGSVAFVLAAFGVTSMFLWYRVRRHESPPWLAWAVTVFITADLMYFGLPLVNAETDVLRLERGDAITRFLTRERSLFRVYGLEDRGSLFNLQDVEGETGLQFARLSEYTNFIQGYRLDNFSNRPAGPHGIQLARGFDSPLVSLLNVKYAVVSLGYNIPAGLEAWKPVVQTHGMALYENPRVYRRALDSYGYTVLHDRVSILRTLSRPDYDPHRFIVLEQHPDIPTTFLTSPPYVGQRAHVEVTAYSGKRVTVQAVFTHAGFLVLNDLFYPEWAAYLDGRPTAIYRANYLFRAVAVPAGTHEVSFIFRDRMLVRGAVGSGVAAAVSVLAWLIERRRQRPVRVHT